MDVNLHLANPEDPYFLNGDTLQHIMKAHATIESRVMQKSFMPRPSKTGSYNCELQKDLVDG